VTSTGGRRRNVTIRSSTQIFTACIQTSVGGVSAALVIFRKPDEPLWITFGQCFIAAYWLWLGTRSFRPKVLLNDVGVTFQTVNQGQTVRWNDIEYIEFAASPPKCALILRDDAPLSILLPTWRWLDERGLAEKIATRVQLELDKRREEPGWLVHSKVETEAGKDASGESAFWDIIDEVRFHSGVLGRHARNRPEHLFARRLRAMTDDELLHFMGRLAAVIARAYRWDLWAAAYLALGGAGDDEFADFRTWLVFQGRDAYERVLSDPDSLDDLSWDDDHRDFEDAEQLGYLPDEEWERRHGDTMSLHLDQDAPEPAGEAFPEDDDSWFATRFPRLFARSQERQRRTSRTRPAPTRSRD
jgi:hypothetical protein